MELKKAIRIVGTLKRNDGMRYLYGVLDEKFVKATATGEKRNPSLNFKFRLNHLLNGKTSAEKFDKKDLPVVFKCNANTLLELCVKIIDAMPLPRVYTWNTEDTCRWLWKIGYKQYQNTFRANLINGHNLLLLDASALSAMNIKDFDHIKDISRGIRSLFYFEMTKFGRSITLYPEFHRELYKLFRIKTGAKYDIPCSEVWRKMQLIRQNEPNYIHWDTLERWLSFTTGPKCKEIIGAAHRNNIYACHIDLPTPKAVKKVINYCKCIPPCECHEIKLSQRRPWRFKCLPHLKPDMDFVDVCEKCIPPCSCRWSSKKYNVHPALSYLKKASPEKYGYIYRKPFSQRPTPRYSIDTNSRLILK